MSAATLFPGKGGVRNPPGDGEQVETAPASRSVDASLSDLPTGRLISGAELAYCKLEAIASPKESGRLPHQLANPGSVQTRNRHVQCVSGRAGRHLLPVAFEGVGLSRALHRFSGTCAEDKAFEERVACKAIGAVDSGAR